MEQVTNSAQYSTLTQKPRVTLSVRDPTMRRQQELNAEKKSIADDICVVNTFPTNDGGLGDKCQISISVSFSVAREAKISFPA